MIVSRGSTNWSSHDKLLLPGGSVQQHLALPVSQVSGEQQHSHQGYWCEEDSSEEHHPSQSGHPQRDWTHSHLHLLHHHLQYSQWLFSQLWHWDQVSVICNLFYNHMTLIRSYILTVFHDLYVCIICPAVVIFNNPMIKLKAIQILTWTPEYQPEGCVGCA